LWKAASAPNFDVQLQKQTTMIRSFSWRLEEAPKIEQRHPARELHDQIGRALTAAKIHADMPRASAQADVAARLDANATILHRLLQQPREISLDLRPQLRDDLSLAPARRCYISQPARRAGLQPKFSAEPFADNVPSHTEIASFRLLRKRSPTRCGTLVPRPRV
jgi:signal transduction histidine kinase